MCLILNFYGTKLVAFNLLTMIQIIISIDCCHILTTPKDSFELFLDKFN